MANNKQSKRKRTNSSRSLPSSTGSQRNVRSRTPSSSSSRTPNLPSNNVVRNAINSSVRRHNKRAEQLAEAADLFPLFDEDGENEEDSASPLIELFVNESGAGVYKAMTPFTRLEFERLWDIIHVPFLAEYRNGRGRQPSTKPKDALFILLSVMKLPTTWGNHGAMFAISAHREWGN